MRSQALGNCRPRDFIAVDHPIVPHVSDQVLQRLGMGCPFHQHPVHCRDQPLVAAFRKLLGQPPGGLQNAQVFVDVPAGAEAVPVGPSRQKGRQVVTPGREHHTSGGLETGGASPGTIMPVEASDALQQNVHGAKVGDEQVGVDVQGLLQRLGADHHPAAVIPFPSDLFLNGGVQQPPVLCGEPAVVQSREAQTGEQQCPVFGSARLFQRPLGLDGKIDGVANDQHLGALTGRRQRPPGNVWKFSHGRCGADRDALASGVAF